MSIWMSAARDRSARAEGCSGGIFTRQAVKATHKLVFEEIDTRLLDNTPESRTLAPIDQKHTI